MDITSIIIRKVFTETKRLLATVDIVIDNNLLIKNIRLFDNGTKMFVEFPSSSRDPAYPDIIPLNEKTRQYIENEIITEYQQNIKEVS